MKRMDTNQHPPTEKHGKVVDFPMHDESALDSRRDALLARFGRKAGKHGPLASRRVAVMIRIPLTTDARAENLARALGSRKTTLIAQAVTVLMQCQASRWYSALAAFQKASGGGAKLPDWFAMDDSTPEGAPVDELKRQRRQA